MISEFSEKEKLSNSEKVTMEDSWAGLHEFPRPCEESFGLDSSNSSEFLDILDNFEEKQIAKGSFSSQQGCLLAKGKL